MLLRNFTRNNSDESSETTVYNDERMKNLEVKGGETISKIDCEHMNGIYRDLVDLVGLEGTLQIFSQYKGQQISFPVKLMSRDYVTEQIQNEYLCYCKYHERYGCRFYEVPPLFEARHHK